jgi:hypothetical protein
VVAFLEEKHKGNYYVINVSNREYDSYLFDGRVKSYEWNDHQAPCLTTLFEITDFTSKYLKCMSNITKQMKKMWLFFTVIMEKEEQVLPL